MYPPYDQPAVTQPPAQMTKAEAKRHFDWFVAQEPHRVKHLLAFAARDGVGPDELDFSRDSLLPLWRWLSQKMESTPLVDVQAAERLAALPEWIPDKSQELIELSPLSMTLALDAGFYLGEVFRRRHPEVKWSLWLGNTGPKNRPYLTGFRLPLVPSQLVTASAWATLRGEGRANLLLEAFERWETYVK